MNGGERGRAADETVGARIRAARTARGLSCGDLAAAAGVSARAVQRWEEGHSEPRLDSLLAVARACGVGPDELLGLVPSGTVRDPGRIGGSDAAVVLGVGARWSPSPVALWQRLVWRSAADDAATSPQVEAGRRFEWAILRWWAGKRNVWPGALQYGVELRDAVHEFLQGHPDAFVPASEEVGGLLVEAKLVRSWRGWGEEGTAEIPPYYLAQCRHYLALARNVAGIEVAAYCDMTRELRVYRVEQDHAAAEAHLEALHAWWHRHVVPARAALAAGEDPWRHAPSDVVEPPPLVVAAGEAVADAADLELVEQYRALKRQRDQLDARLEEARRAVMARLQERSCSVLLDGEGAPVARLTAVETRSLDSRALLARHPELEKEDGIWRTRRSMRLTVAAGDEEE
jgi:transcriptional regulator with XRE-family HTH domain